MRRPFVERVEIFLSLPITSNLDESGLFKAHERAFYQRILDALAEKQIIVHSAVINEDWGARKLSVVEFTNYDVQAIAASMALVAVTRDRITRDIMLEVGLALGLGKSVVLAVPEQARTTHMLDGLADLGKVKVLRFGSQPADLQSVGRRIVGALGIVT